MTWEIAVPLIAAILLFISTMHNFFLTRRLNAAKETESEASAADTIMDAAKKLLDEREEAAKMFLAGLEEREASAELLIEELEKRIESLEEEVRMLSEKIDKYRKREREYKAEMEAKDVRIEDLRQKLFAARDERDALAVRVSHLEDVCRRAGINGN